MIGERVNNYRIVSVLGEGGMGAVYLAEHPFMGRKAAIKVLRGELAQDKGLVERFMNEARAANAIQHPNIIDIIDVGILASGIPYLMMELLNGESLARRLERERRIAVTEAVNIAVQTASALNAAHAKGIVHRDLKPDNLFLVPDDRDASREQVKVLDFGIAKLRGELSGSGAKTQSGSVMGTPPYMSPEQCRGITDEIDERTDIYALGIILYEMLTGAPPFVSEGWGEVVLMHVTKAVPPPRQKNPEIPAALEAAILKALAKAPAERWTTMAEMDSALRAAIGAPARGFVSGPPAVPARPVPPGATMPRPPTTLGAAAGEVTPPTRIAADGGEAGARAPWWRRPAAILAGGVAAAAVALPLMLSRRTPTAAMPATSTAAPVTTPAVVVSPPAPVVVAPPPPAPPPPAQVAPAAPVVATAPREGGQESGGHHKAAAHRHEAHAAKKAIGAPAPAGAPIVAPSPPPAPPPPAPVRAKAAAEKW